MLGGPRSSFRWPPVEPVMADLKDVSTVIASALSEVSMHGTLDVEMDGESRVVTLGHVTGEDVDIVVTITPVDREAA